MKLISILVGALTVVSTIEAAPHAAKRQAAIERRIARRNQHRHAKLTGHNHALSEDGDSVTTYNNWAGAIQVVSGGGVYSVSGVVNVPTPSPPPGATNASELYGGSAWVGISGTSGIQGCSSNSIFQTGIDWYFQSGSPSFDAWWEWYPGPTNYFQLDLNAGDFIKMSVQAGNDNAGSTSGTFYITNESTGKQVQQFVSNQPSLCQGQGEWIVEDTGASGASGGPNGDIPFAQFTPVSFYNTSMWSSVTSGQFSASGAGLVDMVQNGPLVNCTHGGAQNADLTCTYVGVAGASS